MKKHIFVLFTFVVTLAFTGSISAQKDTNPEKIDDKTILNPTPTPSPTPMKLERTKPFDGEVEFPEVDGWELGRRSTFPQKELGYSVNYESPIAGRVTVYVYTGGVSRIPNDLTGPVAAQMKQAKSDIKQAVDAGYYDSVKDVRSETITLGGTDGKVKALYTLLDLRANGNKLDSEIYVFPYNGYFVKLRATRPASEKGSKIEAMEDLLKALDDTFAF